MIVEFSAPQIIKMGNVAKFWSLTFLFMLTHTDMLTFFTTLLRVLWDLTSSNFGDLICSLSVIVMELK